MLHLFTTSVMGECPAPLTAPWAHAPPQERYWFCMAPANLRNPVSAAALARFATRYAARQPVAADVAFRERPPATSDELCDLEAAHQVPRLIRLRSVHHVSVP